MEDDRVEDVETVVVVAMFTVVVVVILVMGIEVVVDAHERMRFSTAYLAVKGC